MAVIVSLALAACRRAPRAHAPGAVSQHTDPPLRPRARARTAAATPAGVTVPVGAAPDWFALGQAFADRTRLLTAFARAGYRPPRGSYALVARVSRGVGGQPAFTYYSLGDSAFRNSYDRFKPGSTIKQSAVVAALSTLRRYGLSGAAKVRFRDSHGYYYGSVRTLYSRALRHSDNLSYDRLLRIAGLAEIPRHLSPARGFPNLQVQESFMGKLHGYSPAIAYREGARRGTIPPRAGVPRHAHCPRYRNCATLFELQDVMRRIVLHHELPREARFDLHREDVAAIRALLLSAMNRLSPGPSRALGHPARIYNSVGHIRGADIVENTIIVDRVTGDRYLLIVGMPMKVAERWVWLVEQRLAELSRQILLALRRVRPGAALALQRDAGAPLDVRLVRQSNGKRRLLVRDLGGAGVDAVEVLWTDRPGERRRLVLSRRPGQFAAPIPAPSPGLLVVRALRGGRPVAWRALVLPST